MDMMTNSPTASPESVKIPCGYKRIEGQTRKGDAVWHGDEQKFRRVTKEYPNTYPEARIFIRRCTVEQTELPGTEPTITVHDGHGNNPRTLNRAQYDELVKSGMMWEFHPDAPHAWPHG